MKKIILFIMCFTLLISACGKDNTQMAEVYFINTSSGEMAAEERAVNFDKDLETFAKNVIEELLEGPKDANLQSVITAGTVVRDIEIQGTVAYVSMSKEFEEGEKVNKLLSRYTLITTLCSIEGIQKAKILVEGKEIMSLADGTPLGALGKEDIVSLINSEDDASVSATLYFWNHDITACEKETRIVNIKEGETLEKVVVQEIINGPKSESLKATVTNDVKVIDVKIQDDVCFVNLSEEFITKNTGGSAKENGAIYSIVNSLCEIKEINKVQFLIEGEKREEFGQFIFNETFQPSFNW